MVANPEPEVALRHGHGQRPVATPKTNPPKATALLKAQRTVFGIFLPETVGFARGDAGGGWERGVGTPEFRTR